MERVIKFTDEQKMFRQTVAKFIDKEIAPYYDEWDKNGISYEDYHEAYRKMAELGMVCPDADPKYGGQGVDWLYNVIIAEEFAAKGYRGFNNYLHNDLAAPYFETFGNDEQKERWLPDIIAGKTLTCIALTEPNSGSDLASLQTKAIKDGDDYILNGQKVFITGGLTADLIMVAARVDGDQGPAITLFGVDANSPGLVKKPISQIAFGATPRIELFLEDVRVPAKNMLGEQGKGFKYMMQKLQQERLIVVVVMLKTIERMLDLTLQYVKERQQFGKPIGSFQNTRFKMAEIVTKTEIFRTFVDNLIMEHIAGHKVVREVSMAKLYGADLSQEVAAQCQQFFGGYGLSTEYEIGRLAVESRFDSIYAGTSEVMKINIHRDLGL